jgi:hypothetical protein
MSNESAARHGLGRLIEFDERSRDFPMSRVVSTPPRDRTSRFWWQGGWWGDQGAEPQCVAYAWGHWIADGPDTSRTLRAARDRGPAPYVKMRDLYCRAQQLDPWPGDCESPRNQMYDGTSVLAGAKALREMGYIESYWWAFNIGMVIDALLTTGPVIVGTTWYAGMSEPDADGYVNLTGEYEGGHAYALTGVSLPKNRARIKNSWGRHWGRNGTAWLRLEDLGALLADRGEAVLAKEARPASG